MTRKMDLRIRVGGTVVAAMTMALSFLLIELISSDLDLSLGMVLLILYSFRHGLFPGITTGFVWGMLNIILGAAMRNFLSVPQIIFEYPFALAFGGASGVPARKVQLYFQANHLESAACTTILGSAVAIFTRWFWHFWAGVLVWGMYAPEEINPYLYSSVLNGTSTVVNCLYASLTLGLLAKVAP